MSQSEDAAGAAARLEDALERIAALAQRRAEAAPAVAANPAEASELAARLDALIGRLRAALGPKQ